MSFAVCRQRFPEVYHPGNTVMLDDLRRNYVLNIQNGLVIRPFRKSMTSGRGDRELVKLEVYFRKIGELGSFESLDHDKWERYVKEELRALANQQEEEEAREGE